MSGRCETSKRFVWTHLFDSYSCHEVRGHNADKQLSQQSVRRANKLCYMSSKEDYQNAKMIKAIRCRTALSSKEKLCLRSKPSYSLSSSSLIFSASTTTKRMLNRTAVLADAEFDVMNDVTV